MNLKDNKLNCIKAYDEVDESAGMRIGMRMMELLTPYPQPTLVFQLSIQAVTLQMILSVYPCNQESG